MKKVLVIGSTVVDVIIQVDHLPSTQEDVHVQRQHMALGGCAYNVSDMIRHFNVPYTLFSPVGSGAYGDFVRTQLAARGVSTPIPCPEQENGCCYCFIEADGERTFLSYHGAEYRFRREWFQIPDASEINAVYICGLEIEEPTGTVIVEYLEAHPEFRLYFAPGPRISKINPELLARIFSLHPVLHLNEQEALFFLTSNPAVSNSLSLSDPRFSTGPNAFDQSLHTATEAPVAADSLPQTDAATPADRIALAAREIFSRTGNDVIITLGAKGAYYHTASASGLIPGVAARQVDTIGAGDSHIGAVIACEQLGHPLPEAIRMANHISAKVVETSGALLDDAAFQSVDFD